MVSFSVAVSALQAAFRRQAITSNNVANISSPGFKRSRAHLVEGETGGTRVAATPTDPSQGPFVHTGRSLNLAVAGEGFFRVEGARGDRFTRMGFFGLDAGRNIVDPFGNRLAPGFTVPDGAQTINVASDGTLSAVLPDGTTQTLGQTELYRFANPQGLGRDGQGLLSVTPNSGAPQAGASGQIVQGVLEGSNVELAGEITDQIITRAMLRANVASIRTQDEMLGEILDITR